jgi:hypothetical protein
MHPAESGHYRFRTERVYRRAALSMIGKIMPQEPVTPAETGRRRNCRTLPINTGEQYVQRNIFSAEASARA